MTHAHLTWSIWIKLNKIQFRGEEIISESEVSQGDQKFNNANEQKTRSTKSKKWRQARTSVDIAWTNEQKADLRWLWRHMVVTKILTKWKKHSRTSADVQSKEFSLTRQNSRPRMDYEWIGESISQESSSKNRKKNKKTMSKCRMWTKNN